MILLLILQAEDRSNFEIQKAQLYAAKFAKKSARLKRMRGNDDDTNNTTGNLFVGPSTVFSLTSITIRTLNILESTKLK